MIEPHLPTGWENISIDNLPVGTNTVSFSRSKTEKGVEYLVNGKESGWNYVLKLPDDPEAKYYLNGQRISFNSAGIRMRANRNTLLVVVSDR